jgi:hypothetical protein
MDRWQQLQDDIGVFTEKTFPDATARSKALHLAEEAHEAAADPGDILEWADCMILLSDGARKSGFTMEDLYQAVVRKMEINKKRTWDAGDKDGIVRHVKAAG